MDRRRERWAEQQIAQKHRYRRSPRKGGTAAVALGALATDPISPLGPVRVLAANYMIGDFFATEQNG